MISGLFSNKYFASLFWNEPNQFSFLNSIDSDYVDELHQKYLVDKRLVEPSWRQFSMDMNLLNLIMMRLMKFHL